MSPKKMRPVPLGRLRLAHPDDAPLIMQFVTDSMKLNFRVHNLADLHNVIETSVLSICLLDKNEEIVGFLAAKDYPIMPAVSPGAWEDFILNKYKAIELNARNTLFIHMLCWHQSYGRDAVDNMLKSVYMHDPYVHYIAIMKSLVTCQMLVPGQSRSEGSFKRLQTVEKGVPSDQLPSLWVADRKEVSPRLRIRRAVEADNDDIVPIIERHSHRLRELYGDFYVSEIIAHPGDSDRVILVCEHKELAVGVMCLNTQINYEALEESYELSPFGGLRHLDKHALKVTLDSDTSFFSVCNHESHSNLIMEPDVNFPKDKSKLTWVYGQEKSEVKFVAPFDGYSQLDILSLLDDEDEDELEYDIVNIDTDLLRLPRLFVSEDPIKKDTSPLELVQHSSNEESFGKLKNVTKDKRKKQSTSKGYPEPTRYSGEPNAFLLELFAMHPDYDERYGFDMLEAAYELFPGRDYCIVNLPSSQSTFPLLEHFSLVTPFGSRKRFVNSTLYVAHINSVRGDIRVRAGEPFDLACMPDVVEHSPRRQDLINLFRTSLQSNTLTSLMLLSENQPVGVVLLSPLEECTSIRNEYDLEPESRQPGADGSILACVMSSIVEPHGRWFLREVIRQTNYVSLFWICRQYAKGDASPDKNMMSLASVMIPIRPRRYMPVAAGRSDLDKVFKNIATPFALWTIERVFTSLPKVYINANIVVVGASRTGLAFIESLLMGPSAKYLTFTNLTLISEFGLGVSEGSDTALPRGLRYTDRYLKSLPFCYYLDVKCTLVVGIDRKKKCIHFKDDGIKYYDELILACGQQFQHPEYMKESLEVAQEVAKGKPCSRILMDNPIYKPDKVPPPPVLPHNVFLINSSHEANSCFKKLMTLISDLKNCPKCLCAENPVVVYGDCIEAYTCMAALLEVGVEPAMIVFVENFPPEDKTALRVNCFNSETVDKRVQNMLKSLGIRTYTEAYLESWNLSNNRVESLCLMKLLVMKIVPCFALFYFGLKAINLHAFKAINECGLVYDAGVVVGTRFETNDPHVFAAGTCTRYSRRLLPPAHHSHYCSEDVGEALADIFLHKLDPFVYGVVTEEENEINGYSHSLLGFKGSSQSKVFTSHVSVCSAGSKSSHTGRGRWQPVMKFDSPIVVSATLPGPLYYTVVRKPGPIVPMAVQLLLPHQGHTLITDKRGNYFRLHLNSLHRVESITCLSKQPYSSQRITRLYNKHEACFGKLLARFQMNLIDDFYDYFTQPWLTAMFQEPFYNLLDGVDEQFGQTIYKVMASKFTLLNAGGATVAFEKQQTEKTESEPTKPETEMPHRKAQDVPSECGQNASLRREATTYWKSVGGESVMMKNLTAYLKKYNVCNSQYAVPELMGVHNV